MRLWRSICTIKPITREDRKNLCVLFSIYFLALLVLVVVLAPIVYLNPSSKHGTPTISMNSNLDQNGTN